MVFAAIQCVTNYSELIWCQYRSLSLSFSVPVNNVKYKILVEIYYLLFSSSIDITIQFDSETSFMYFDFFWNNVGKRNFSKKFQTIFFKKTQATIPKTMSINQVASCPDGFLIQNNQI